jgi:ribosome maturation factor RimP
MADVRQKEKQLQSEIGARVEGSLDGVEVLAVELQSPDRFTVYVDHPAGVDHTLCARVTDVLRDYLREYTVDVSSPGTDRPLRKPREAAHARPPLEGRARVRGRGPCEGGRHRSPVRRNRAGEPDRREGVR